MAKKPKVAKVAGEYKDPYSGKVYASKEAFLEMKLSHKNTNFTKLYNAVKGIVESGVSETVVFLDTDARLETMDDRLPRYVLGFINGGENYKPPRVTDAWEKLILTKKQVAVA